MKDVSLRKDFLKESYRNISSINKDLKLLIKSPEDTQLLNRIFRAVHTIKGSAGSLNYLKIQELAHTSENLLNDLREGNSKLSDEIVEILTRTFEVCRELIESIEKISDEGDIDIKLVKSEINSSRVLNLGNIVGKFERFVENISKSSDKHINLKLSGLETKLDALIFEALKDPLLHMLRNACDHGIESINERKECGKDITGVISINASKDNEEIVICVEDDGRGLDSNQIKDKALEKGLVQKIELEQLTENEVYKLVFIPGFSTAKKVTKISGRGVGMDIVLSNISNIGGRVKIDSVLGQGTTIEVRIHTGKM